MLKIPVTNLTEDEVKPEPKVTPFYWNSSTDNSVYSENGVLQGHIELESDLPDTFNDSYVSGVNDRDPKVSGKIKLEGIVYDNVRLKTITFNGTEASNFVGTYDEGEWTPSASLPTGVISFNASDIELSQNGHYVKYELVIDTEKLNANSPVVSDKGILIGAIDWKDRVSETSNTKTINTVQEINGKTYNVGTTNYYRMDVVPYITEVTTSLSDFNRGAPSTFARTAKGKYVVKENADIVLKGYNLGTAPTVTLNGTSLTKSTSTNVGSSAKSGALSVSVNGIEFLNNKNNNETEYNMQPNGTNNNTLTDDMYIDVWQFKNAAEPVSGGAEYVTMKINPKTGVPGFSFANSILYFNMPGYNSNQGDTNWRATSGLGEGPYSQIAVGMNYGGFSHNTFAFDAYGYSYGAAMCTDTQSAKASAYFQFFSREAPLPYNKLDQNLNYVNAPNCSRLDSSSIEVASSKWITDINRIQSPSMETSYSGGVKVKPSSTTPVYVFMAYYDQPVKQVRFRWGTVADETDTIDGKNIIVNQHLILIYLKG